MMEGWVHNWLSCAHMLVLCLTYIVAVHEQLELVLLQEQQIVRLSALLVILTAWQWDGRRHGLWGVTSRVSTQCLG